MMERTIDIELPAAEVAQIEAQMQEHLAEMQRANERIQKDQVEIDRLKAKTRATLAELAALKGS